MLFLTEFKQCHIAGMHRFPLLILGMTFTVAIFAFVLHTPVPDGLSEPWKYRLLVATFSSFRFVGRVSAFLQPDNKLAYIEAIRYARALVNTPSPSTLPGSNIRSEVLAFDGVRVRLYRSTDVESSGDLRPALIYIHGGGFVFGSADTYDQLTRGIAESLNNTVVLSIDYRLAPESPFPAAYIDCMRASTWLLRHAEEYGVDATRVAIAGDSAGGLLAAAITQSIHDDRTVPDLRLQVLVYPKVQTLDNRTPSMLMYDHIFGDAGILSRKAVATFTMLAMTGREDLEHRRRILENEHLVESFRRNSDYMEYISYDVIPEEIRRETKDLESMTRQWTEQRPGNKTLWEELKVTYLDPRWAPLLRKSLSGLPPAFIVTCGFDSIRDDGIFYARRLEAAGVKSTWKHYKNGFHGVFFLLRPFRFELGEEIKQDILDFIHNNI